MVDQQTDQLLDAQSVPVIHCTSIIWETDIEKTTAHQNVANDQISKILSYSRIRLIAKAGE